MPANLPAIDACLSDEQLDCFHAGELSREQGEAAAAHLASCVACAGRAAAMRTEHESGIAILQSIGPPPDELPAGPAGSVGLEADAVAGYEILEVIGRGGQGIVYRAVQRGTKREVALKVLREGLWAAAASRRRFEREIELCARLNHPHIVTVFDSGQTRDGRRFVAMDLVRGLPLGRWAVGRNRRQVLALFAQVCHAVNHAHQRGVIHRDLKPGNILVVEGSEFRVQGSGMESSLNPESRTLNPQPKILDFGLARAQNDAGVTLTGLAHVAGTLAYMSPEHARGQPDAIDTRSDVYALGVILYELIAGAFPYPVRGDTIEVLRHIAESAPTPLPRSHGIEGDLETIVLKALSKEPSRRYQTAGDLGRDVEHFLAGDAIEARRDSTWYVLRKTLRRYRLGVGIAAAFLLLVLGSAIALAVMYAQQRHLRAIAEDRATEARLAQAKANQRFEDLRKLAKTFIFELDPKLRHLPGTAPARKLVVENALEYLDRLSGEAIDDADLLRELAAAYMTIGDVQGDATTSNLGDFAAALKSQNKARDILEEARRRVPGDRLTLATLQLNQCKRADLLAAAGRIDEALAGNASALQLAEQLATEHADNQNVLNSLADTHERRGNLLLSLSRVDEALSHYEQTRAINERLSATTDPTDLWAARERAVILTKLAQVWYARGEKTRSLENYRKFLEIVEPLRASESANLVVRKDVATANQWIGILFAETARAQEAIEPLAKGLEIFDGLLRDEPNSEDLCMALVTTLSRMGEARLALREHDAARDCFERCLTLIEAQVAKAPDRPDTQRLRAITYYKMHELLLAQAAIDETSSDPRHVALQAALGWLQRARHVFEEMKSRGILAHGDAGVLDELAGEIRGLEKRLE